MQKLHINGAGIILQEPMNLSNRNREKQKIAVTQRKEAGLASEREQIWPIPSILSFYFLSSCSADRHTTLAQAEYRKEDIFYKLHPDPCQASQPWPKELLFHWLPIVLWKEQVHHPSVITPGMILAAFFLFFFFFFVFLSFFSFQIYLFIKCM